MSSLATPMSEVQALLDAGQRPEGEVVGQLTDALICLAGQVDYVEADKMVALLLLPACAATASPATVMSQIYVIHEALASPSPRVRVSAWPLARNLARSEVALRPTHPAVTVTAKYEGKHRYVP